MLRRFDITVPDDLEEPLGGLAERLGLVTFSSPQIEDTGGGEEDFRFTGETVVSFLVSTVEQNPEYISKEIEHFLAEFGAAGSAKLEIRDYPDNQDWMEGFRMHFQPIRVGSGIVVRPPWAEPLEEEAQATTILIDPGMAFGTGTHETTRLCLTLLAKLEPCGGRFLDIGAGSGILAFYLAKKGAAAVTALEIDGAAVENMRKNAALNGIEKQVEMRCGDLAAFEPAWPADGVAANITSPVLTEHLARMAAWAKQGAWGVFSGVNDTNAPRVREALKAASWRLEEEITEADWHAFRCTRV
ncbi:MAG TPA: 50S ribosomal protein L11 methyltransferase [Candidatus Ozemobacteraceae bacterium]|nr:50S ribosomal protein L11 methyltransferase [Candidatus Ozemobacteraceae bacterium]